MTVTSRPFRWNDLADLHALISETWRRHGPKVSLHIGDLYWGLRPQPKRDPERDIQLWHDAGGGLAGFVWIDHSADGNLLLRDPEDTGLHGQMLDWLEAYARAKECSEWSAACFEGDDGQIGQLEQRGYVKSSERDPHLYLNLTDAIFNAFLFLPCRDIFCVFGKIAKLPG